MINKYIKWYENLIDKAKNRIKEQNTYYEKHHIIPKCIGEKNEDGNYVLLTAREHIIAHMFLVRIYPNNRKLKYALNAMTMNKIGGRFVENYLTIKQISRIREDAAKARIGTKMPKSFSEKISIANSKRVWSEESKRKNSESHKNKNINSEHLKKYEFKKGSIPWNKGKKMSETTKNKLKKSRENLSDEARHNYSEAAKKRGFCGPTKKVIDPIGNIFESTEACARKYNVCAGTIRNWIKKFPEKGFKFVD